MDSDMSDLSDLSDMKAILSEDELSEQLKDTIKTPCYHLHAIDLRRTDVDQIRAELMEQMSKVGFLLLSHVPDYDEEEYLSAIKAFHSLPEHVKKTLYLHKDNPHNNNIYSGYQPFIKNDPSHKEFFDMGYPIVNMSSAERAYPLYENPPALPKGDEWIYKVFEKTFFAWYTQAVSITSHLAVGLGKPANFFEPWFEGGSLTTMRQIHYLPRAMSGVDSSNLTKEQAMLITPEHADSGLLTFLATFNYPGLQVLLDGVYRDIKPVPNTLVVNLGDTFARMTDYKLLATFHRVLDLGIERYSAPLFLAPKYSSRIPKGLLASERLSVDEDLKDTDPMFGDWLVRRMMASYGEWKNLEMPPERKAAIEAIQDTDFRNY